MRDKIRLYVTLKESANASGNSVRKVENSRAERGNTKSMWSRTLHGWCVFLNFGQ